MKLEERKQMEKHLPTVYKKGKALSALGAAIGAGIGAVIGLYVTEDRLGRALFGGAGAGVGILISYIVGIVINHKVDLLPLQKLESKTETFGGILSVLMSIAGIVGFILTGKWIGIIGAVFFALCGIYLLIRRR